MTAPFVNADAAYELLARRVPPSGLRVVGQLDYSATTGRKLPPRLPENLTVDALNLRGTEIAVLPAGLRCQVLDASGTLLKRLPDDLVVRTRLELSGCEDLEELPRGLTVGSLAVRGCAALQRLPEGLDVWFLDLSGCHAFETWPQEIHVRGGRLQLRGCAAVRELPSGLCRLSALNVRDCPLLKTLPDDLVVTGWIDLAHSGLTDELALPPGLERTQLRWAGVNVDRRIAFHPESLTIAEVLGEQNAERRRVLLDRYGFSRFMHDAAAETVDRDQDPGGERRLLRFTWKDDEPLVTLSCHCPSTGRQYIIRVPPDTATCHQAAAWIAGFNDPDDYRPLVET